MKRFNVTLEIEAEDILEALKELEDFEIKSIWEVQNESNREDN